MISISSAKASRFFILTRIEDRIAALDTELNKTINRIASFPSGYSSSLRTSLTEASKTITVLGLEREYLATLLDELKSIEGNEQVVQAFRAAFVTRAQETVEAFFNYEDADHPEASVARRNSMLTLAWMLTWKGEPAQPHPADDQRKGGDQ